MAEGLVRHLPPFSEFLNAAALTDTEQVNFTNLGRELGVSRETVRGYFEILSDTLLARMLPPYREAPEASAFPGGEVLFSRRGRCELLARRGTLEPGSELFGKAFENWIFHELRCYNSYRERFAELSFWRLSTGVEVDFIVNDMECAIECKSATAVQTHHLKGLRELAQEHPGTGRRSSSAASRSRTTSDGIEILHVEDFLGELWAGGLF